MPKQLRLSSVGIEGLTKGKAGGDAFVFRPGVLETIDKRLAGLASVAESISGEPLMDGIRDLTALANFLETQRRRRTPPANCG